MTFVGQKYFCQQKYGCYKRSLRGSLMCLAYFDVFHGCLYNQVLADVRSTSVGIKCLYCIGVLFYYDIFSVTGHKMFKVARMAKLVHIYLTR